MVRPLPHGRFPPPQPISNLKFEIWNPIPYPIDSSSTSKMSVAFGGMAPG